MDIAQSTFIVTGGASGLGGATAQMITEAGGNAVLADLNEDLGHSHAEALGSNALFVKTDVASAESVQNTVNAAQEKFGGIHGAINCAGIAIIGKVLSKDGAHSLDLFNKGLQVNLAGTFNVIRLVAEAAKNADPDTGGERAVFVNTASVAAFDGQIGQASYSATKGGVVGMTLPIARELASYGMRVMTIAPGIFETPMMSQLPDAAKESLGKQVPFPSRLGRPAEYAALVKHIIENTMLNGEVIRLDGAIRMAPK
ncbi:MAG TPA: 3-hydroxyacyl-CoA dehydrogenase [Gammaproteobacteria bacterium]|nr:3-hydroxyacyl-CoA dehydrogenase [Gammaproteobacteria bacterium]